MLSCMETKQGLTVIGPQGQVLRLLRRDPIFLEGKNILQLTLPAEQQWQQLQSLVLNPFKALVSWCERFGLTFKEDGGLLKLNDVPLNSKDWLPLFQRTQRVCGSPQFILNFANRLGDHATAAKAGNVTLHLREDKLRGRQAALLKKVGLAATARTGDIVTETSSGPVPYLVSYDDLLVQPDGEIKGLRGIVLSPVLLEKEADDVLAQPAVLGFDQTYRCEEGTSEGWLHDRSFDSLAAARLNAHEIQATGAEVRIINRITGDAVSLN